MSIDFHVMGAADPRFSPRTFDAIVCRHLLGCFQPAQVLARWAALLKPAGRLVLVEGYWNTGGGLHAAEIVAALPAVFDAVSVEI